MNCTKVKITVFVWQFGLQTKSMIMQEWKTVANDKTKKAVTIRVNTIEHFQSV